MSYREVYAAATADPNAFWAEAARGIDWDVEPTTVLDDYSTPPFYPLVLRRNDEHGMERSRSPR